MWPERRKRCLYSMDFRFYLANFSAMKSTISGTMR